MEEKSLWYYERQSDAKTVTEVTCEDVLPDFFPDVQKIVSVRCTPVLAGQRISEHEISCAGTAIFECVYLSPEHTVHARQVHTGFDLSAAAEGLDESCIASLTPRVEGLSWRLSGPRKLAMRCRVVTDVSAQVLSDAAPDESDVTDGGTIEYDRTERTVSRLFSGSDGERRLCEDCDIPQELPPAAEIIRATLEALVPEVRINGDVAEYRVDCRYQVLYRAVGDGTPQYICFSGVYPCSGSIPMDGVPGGVRVIGEASAADFTAKLYPDALGENRRIEFDWFLSVSVCAFSEETLRLPVDAYAERYPVKCIGSLKRTVRCRLGQNAVFKTDGVIPATDAAPAKIVCVYGSASPEACRIENGRLTVTGAIDVSVLYENDSGVLYSAVGNLPFRYETGANGAQGNVTVRCKVAVCDLTGAIKDGAVAVDAALMLCAFVAEEDTVESVRVLQRDGDVYPEKEDGVLRVFYPEPGESLYSVGKRYHVAVDTLRQANGLEPNVLAADEKTKLLMIP